jgi:carbonic anhydrase
MVLLPLYIAFHLLKYSPEINHPVNKSDVSINALNILPDKLEYLYYPGSLTTPPCSEGVLWYILNKAIPISKKQVSQFKELIDFNSRPVQPIHERKIYKAQ